MSFASMKKSRTEQLNKLTNELNKMNAPQGEKQDDNRFWKPEVDKAGNGYAIIRFLPAPEGEDVPYVRVWDHGFQGPTGQWYIEKSLTTLGQKDPVSEYNSELWATGTKANQEIVRKQKRRLSFISNIYVVKDPAHPENEGKVFLYQYGKKIFDKLNEAMNPAFEDEQAINPFDLWEGANFSIKIRKVEGYRNYDKSEFASPGPLLDTDEELEAVWNQEYALQPFVDPSQFKSYEVLQQKLYKVLGLDGSAPKAQTRAEDDLPWNDEPATAAARPQRTAPPPAQEVDLGEDDDLAFFKKLAEE